MNYKDLAEAQLRSKSFDKYSLPDITEIRILNSDAQAKMSAFLHAGGNPYLFRVGDTAVHVVFTGNAGDTLQKRICHLLSKSI